MAYPPAPGYGYNYGYQPNPYQQPYGNYGGGYTYSNSAYNVNQYNPPHPFQQQPAHMYAMPTQMMQQAPPSTQTIIVNNNMFNTNVSYQGAALQCLDPEELADVEDEEDEEEEEEEEEEDEDVRQTKKKFKKKCRMRAKLQKKIAEKCQEDENFIFKVRTSYINRLHTHIKLDGTIDPTEGTIHYYSKYKDDDPVISFIAKEDEPDDEEKCEERRQELIGSEWSAENDCRYLKNACDGAGTNEDAIIYVCSTRNNAQRQELKKYYKSCFGEDLIETIDSETSGNFKDVLFGLFVPPALFDALSCKKAIQGLGTDESVLMEILLSRTNAQIAEMKDVYGEINPDDCATDKDLEANIVDDTSGTFKRILVSAVQGNRAELSLDKLDEAVEPCMFHDEETDEDRPTGSFQINMDKLVDQAQAERDAKALFEAGEDSFGTDEDTFIRIFSLRSTYQMRETYRCYVKLTQRDVENTIDREFSSDDEKALLTLVQCMKCRPKYFAERLKWTMKGLGTHDNDLIRIIISRAEIDMVQIKEIFLQQNNKTLWKWIDEDCSGDYRKLLQAIVGRD